jgi:predicted secreted protein
MSILSAVAIYFIIWWTVLFAVLPFGVKSAAETGTGVAEGHDAGAPVQPQMLRKAIITTLISCAVFAAVYALVTMDTLSLDWLPGLG